MQFLSVITSVIASIMLLFMAGFIIVKDWRDPVTRYFAFFILSGFIILFTMCITYAFPESPKLVTFNRFTQLGTSLTFASLLLMSLVFPQEERVIPLKWAALIVLPALAVGIVAVATDLNVTKAAFVEGHLVREFGFFYTIWAIVVLIYLIIGTGNFIRKYIITKVAIYKLQMRYMFVGTSLAVTAGAVCSIILPRYFNYSELYVLGPSLACFFAFGSLFYSVISYNLMDITTAIHKTTTYTVITTVIFVPIYLIIRMYDSDFRSMGSVPPYVIAAALVIIFLLFSMFVQPLIDKAFKRKQYEFEGIIDNFIRDVERVRDFRSIIQRSADILYDSLFLRRVFFIMFNNESKRFELFYQKGSEAPVQPVERNSPVIRWFVRNQQILHVDRVYTDDAEFAEIRGDFLDFFNKNNAKLILPVYHERRVLGLLCLGEKDSLAGFKPDEIAKLRYFLSGSTIHISNALTYEESRRQQMITRTMDLSSSILAKSAAAALPNLMGIKFGAFVIPRYGEGIDYFDFIRPFNHGVGFIATDIAGLGISSALYSVVLRSAFQSCIEEAPSSYSVIQKLNAAVHEYSEGKSELVTAYYAFYDLRSTRLIYTNAGFPPLEIFRIEKNDFDSLDTEGIPLGYDPKASYGMGRTNLLRGDIGVIYSKALITSKNQKGENFGLDSLRRIIKERRGDRPSEIARVIKERFLSFLGLLSPESDIVVILFKIV